MLVANALHWCGSNENYFITLQSILDEINVMIIQWNALIQTSSISSHVDFVLFLRTQVCGET
jgi:hypothetical protein